MAKDDPIRAKARERLQLVKAGGDDWGLGTVGIEKEGAAVALAERLAGFTVLFGNEALSALADMHESSGGSVEAALVAMLEKPYREAAGMSEKGARRVLEILLGLCKGDEAKTRKHLRTMGLLEPKVAEELALDVAVVMLRSRMALEEMARLEHWHEKPTLL